MIGIQPITTNGAGRAPEALLIIIDHDGVHLPAPNALTVRGTTHGWPQREHVQKGATAGERNKAGER